MKPEMSKFLGRAATLVTVLLFVTTSVASATDVTPAQRAAIEDRGRQLFRAVVDGNANGVLAITAPSFAFMTLEDQKLSADELASRWQIMMIEYGGVHGNAKLTSASTDGNAITAVYSIDAYADMPDGPRGEPSTSTLYALHKIVWVPVGNAWKAASDTVLRQDSTFDQPPSLK